MRVQGAWQEKTGLFGKFACIASVIVHKGILYFLQ